MTPKLLPLVMQIQQRHPKIDLLQDSPGVVGYWACDCGIPLPPCPPRPVWVPGLTPVEGYSAQLSEYDDLRAAHAGWRERYAEFTQEGNLPPEVAALAHE